MRNDSNLLKHVLSILPPTAAGIGACVVRIKLQPLTFNTEVAFAALFFASVISGVFAIRLLLKSRTDPPESSWIAGLDVVVEPFVSLEVAVGALAIGWLIGTIVALLDFAGTGHSPARLVLPTICAAIAIILGRWQTRPNKIQRIWQLAVAPHGEAKLEALCRTARETNDDATLHAIAKMPRMKPSLLESLAAHVTPAIRADVANNPNSPAALLLKLSHDKSMEVRRAVAFNSAASAEQLRILSRDSDESIREKAASRLWELEVTP